MEWFWLFFVFLPLPPPPKKTLRKLVRQEMNLLFIRIQFDAMGQGWGNGGWAHDYPDAEINFLRGVTRCSGIHIHAEPAVLRLDDDRIFEFPFLYLVEIGRDGGPDFSEKEIENLREYVLRGGFLLIDDFKGKAGWQVFRHNFPTNLSR